ncbi:MAG: hypothetical protein JWR85_2648 [Marmoricola sp.]|nr:hypothetical protein [Marmoricola sp.]
MFAEGLNDGASDVPAGVSDNDSHRGAPAD